MLILNFHLYIVHVCRLTIPSTYQPKKFNRIRPFTELWEVSIEHLRRVWHADWGRLLLRTPGPVPFGTCICSTSWEKRKRSDSALWQKPLHRQKNQKSNVTTQRTPPKTSITQQLRTDLGRSAGVTIATQHPPILFRNLSLFLCVGTFVLQFEYINNDLCLWPKLQRFHYSLIITIVHMCLKID